MIYDLLADVPAPEYIRVLAEIIRNDKLKENEYVKTRINPLTNEFSVVGIYNYLANMHLLKNYVVDVVVDFMNTSLDFAEVVKIVEKAKDYEYGYYVVYLYDTFDIYIIKTNNRDILWVPLTTQAYIPEAIRKFFNYDISLVYTTADRSGILYIFFPSEEAEKADIAKINEIIENKMTWESYKKRTLEVEMPRVKQTYKNLEVYLKNRDGYVEAVVPAESVKKWIEFAIENYYRRAA